MDKFKIRFETIRFTLIILLLTVFLRGASNTLLSDSISLSFTYKYPWIITVSTIVKYFSGMVIEYLPILIVIKVLSKKHNNTRAILIFIISYFLFLTVLMILGKSNLPNVAYDELFGIKYITTSDLDTTITKLPYRVGFIGAILIGYVSSKAYTITRRRSRYGILSFIDKEMLALLISLFFTLLLGIVFAIVWPYIINVTFAIFRWISNDITNPVSSFIYGFVDRIFSILDLSDINRQTFWFTSYGGTWTDSAGINHVGDINIWTAQLFSNNIEPGFGRFITPYYIINLFAFPGYMLGLYFSDTDNKHKLKFILVLIFLILFSLISDISLPLEIFMFVMSPMLYFFHIFIVSSLFALLQGLNIFLGFSYEGSVINASLGSISDLLAYNKIVELRGIILSIVTIGVIILVLYYFFTRFYYQYLSLGLINKFEIKDHVDEFLELIGGLDNIETIHANPFRVNVSLHRSQLFNYEKLETSNISRVMENKGVYSLYYGTASIMIRKEVLLQKKMLDS